MLILKFKTRLKNATAPRGPLSNVHSTGARTKGRGRQRVWDWINGI
jgi:hypothetical protein